MPIAAVRAAYKHFYEVQQKGNPYLSFVQVRDQDKREPVPAATKSRKRKGKGKAAAVAQPQAAAVAQQEAAAAVKAKAEAAAKAKAEAAEKAKAEAAKKAKAEADAKAKAVAAANATKAKGREQVQVARWGGKTWSEVEAQDLFDWAGELWSEYPGRPRIMGMIEVLISLVRLALLPDEEAALNVYIVTAGRRACEAARAISCPAACTSDVAGHL